MAIQEQLKIVSKGVETWNNWRKLHPDTQIDLTGADFRSLDLAGIDLARAKLEGANFAHSDLRNASLASANLSSACLAFADLENAVLNFADLTSADLRATNLRGAALEDATLNSANLAHACLEHAVLAYADLANATLTDADLVGINLKAANLENANVAAVKYDRRIYKRLIIDLKGDLRTIFRRRFDLVLDTTIRCKGVNAATCFGSQRFKLFLQDQDYLEEFLESFWGRRICFFWWLTADCGRSVSRWAGWSVFIAMIFALVYHSLGPDYFASTYLAFNLQNMIYYSVVTFTTLGFGDITPKTTGAAMLVMVEVIIGYVMLGGLITIFASKLSRRGG